MNKRVIHKVAELKGSPFVSESGNKYEINIKKDIIAVLSAGGGHCDLSAQKEYPLEKTSAHHSRRLAVRVGCFPAPGTFSGGMAAKSFRGTADLYRNTGAEV